MMALRFEQARIPRNDHRLNRPAVGRHCARALIGIALGATSAHAAEPVIEEIVVAEIRRPAEVINAFSTQLATAPSNLSTSLDMSPSVALSGQGGNLQAFEIRGLGAERIRITVDGAPLRALRRAGVSGAFLEPAWLEVTSRPHSAPVRTGSGTTGGVIETSTNEIRRNRAHLRFEPP
ncbi:MAG: Plug domain-containing protein [Gammaproteobacteria bacterium]|nr:Plug domain-containing protein [Gammaproteobacteria bacterium]